MVMVQAKELGSFIECLSVGIIENETFPGVIFIQKGPRGVTYLSCEQAVSESCSL
jgi:hypothetical protein